MENDNGKQLTGEQVREQFKKELFDVFDSFVNKVDIREAFEHWSSKVLYGFATNHVEESDFITKAFIDEITKEYRLNLELEVRRQSLDVLNKLKEKSNINEVKHYYNQHVELAEFIS